MTSMENSMHMVAGSNSLQFSVNILAIVIGIAAMVVIVRLNRKLGGRINVALRYFIVGVLCNVAAIVWTLFFEHTYVVGGMSLDVHQNFMTLGMIFFIISTNRFSKLVSNV